MTSLSLKLNPTLDVAELGRTYRETGLVQIADILDPEGAEQLTLALETSTPWTLAYFGPEERPEYLTIEALRDLRPERVGQIMKGLMERSAAHYGFLYLNYLMITAYKAGTEQGHPLHALTEFLNSADFLDFGRRITGEDSVRKVDAQATNFRPGDFLGLHHDTDQAGVERVAAYTLGFTRSWRSDWGGQLLFHDERGDIVRGLAPRWNTLTLFKVPVAHSVATVAPYAQAPRISVVGWLRRDV